MFQKHGIKIGVMFVAIQFAQILVFRNLEMFNMAFCFVNVAFLMLLPIQEKILPLIVAFFAGLLIDVFEDTLGINAAVSVLIVYVKPRVLKVFSIEEDEDNLLTIDQLGVQTYGLYALIVSFIYCMFFFFLETFNSALFWSNIGRVFLSTIYTAIMVVAFSYIFVNNSRKR